MAAKKRRGERNFNDWQQELTTMAHKEGALGANKTRELTEGHFDRAQTYVNYIHGDSVLEAYQSEIVRISKL